MAVIGKLYMNHSHIEMFITIYSYGNYGGYSGTSIQNHPLSPTATSASALTGPPEMPETSGWSSGWKFNRGYH